MRKKKKNNNKMDLVEIDYNDYLAECTTCIDENITCWFTNDWENFVLKRYKQMQGENYEPITIDDIKFRVGDDLLCLSEGVYENEPHTSISSNFGGRLSTLAMLATIFIKNGKLKGKMKIYNASKAPIDTNYELTLNNAELKMLVGLRIWGDGWGYDNCKYKFVKSDLSFTHSESSKEMSIFDRETDKDRRKLLEQYMLEYITKELGPALEDYQMSQLSIKALASNSVGADYSLKNMLSIHNKTMRKAFKNLSEKIISILISLLVKKSLTLQLTDLFGLTEEKNKECNLKVYAGYIDNFESLIVLEDKNPIISNEDDLVIVHVPVEFQELKLNIGENTHQIYKTSGSHLIMSLKKLSDNEVKISLIDFKVLNITPTSETSINVAMDHSIRFAIEQHVKPFLEEAMKEKELQNLAIKPEVDIELDPDDDMMGEDSEEEY